MVRAFIIGQKTYQTMNPGRVIGSTHSVTAMIFLMDTFVIWPSSSFRTTMSSSTFSTTPRKIAPAPQFTSIRFPFNSSNFSSIPQILSNRINVDLLAIVIPPVSVHVERISIKLKRLRVKLKKRLLTNVQFCFNFDNTKRHSSA